MNSKEKSEQDGTSEEEMEEFFNILQKLPHFSLGRNDLCLCGSGKKYKNCCLKKNRPSPSSQMRTESFEVKSDALTPEELQYPLPTLSKEDEELMAMLHHRLQEHPETIESEEDDYFKQLNALRSKYPDHPTILNYLGNGYQCLGQTERLEKMINEMLEEFPNYLFAKTAKANLYLQKDLPEKAFETLNRAYTLKQLYPHRHVFHVTEVKAFEYCMVQYSCKTQNLEQAEFHLQVMQEILEEDDPLLQHAEEIFKALKAIHNFKVGLSHLIDSKRKTKSKKK